MTAEEFQRGQEEAAWRALDILTQWQRENPWSFYKTEYVGKSKFKLTIQNNITKVTFYGETIQDAYAQAASTISLNGGTLTGSDYSDPPYFSGTHWTGAHDASDIRREMLRICPIQPCSCTRCQALNTELQQLEEFEMRKEKT